MPFINELFLGLLGYGGKYILEDTEGDLILLEDSLIGKDRLSPLSIQQVLSLLEIGSNCKIIRDFYNYHRFENKTQSLITLHFVNGLNDLIRAYNKHLNNLEQEILCNQNHFWLTKIQNSLDHFRILFVFVVNLLEEIKEKDLNGIFLLNFLYFKTQQNSHYSLIISDFNKIFRLTFQPLFKMIITWLAYGDIVDPYGEFFIKIEINEEANDGNEKKEGDALKLWKQVQIKMDNCPSFIDSKVIEQIKFIGSVVYVIRRAKGLFLLEKEKFSEDVISLFHANKYEQNIDLHLLEISIGEVHARCSDIMYSIIISNDLLIKHLNFLKISFLHSCGYIMHEFITLYDRFLKNGLSSSKIDRDIKEIFQRVIILGDFESQYVDNLTIMKRDAKRTATDIPVPSQLNLWQVSLKYEPPFPLSLVLTPEIIGKFDKMFRHLLNLKIILYKLKSTYNPLKLEIKKNNKVLPAFYLKFKMESFLTSLIRFIGDDIINPDYMILMYEINNNCKNHFHLNQKVLDFINIVLTKSLILYENSRASYCLTDLLSCIYQFITSTEKSSKDSYLINLQGINLEFDERLNNLINELMVSENQKHLEMLLHYLHQILPE
eukprot:TRINITY_DN1978_c0_g1_i1.p1 TRINITY_DN1978_c0_g1~~TRINITY_DN1978_c0_g1_i1.p1  ORF type:complete len:604 (+),score=136.83 TRINITY_DN1978_c0_g1_i1:1286-3097(+)